MLCCGKEQSTPFCPMCGKKIGQPEPLYELLAYLQKVVHTKRVALKRLEKKGYPPQHEARSEERFNRWAEHLAEHLAKHKA